MQSDQKYKSVLNILISNYSSVSVTILFIPFCDMIGSHDAVTWPTLTEVAVSDPDLICLFFDRLGEGETGVILYKRTKKFRV